VKVVIVDDSSDVRFMFKNYLQANGVAVVGEAESVSEAREIILNQRPDLVLLDFYLKDGTGQEVIKNFANNGDMKFIVMSFFDLKPFRARLSSDGVNNVFSKIDYMDLILDKINERKSEVYNE